MGEAYIQFALAHPNQYRLLFMTPGPALAPERSAIRKGDVDQDAYALLVKTIAEAIANGLLRPELEDAEQVAQVLWSGVHGYASLILTKHNDPWIDWRPAAPTARLVIDTLVAGLIPPGAQGQAFRSRNGRSAHSRRAKSSR
jgi:hypothetical protein